MSVVASVSTVGSRKLPPCAAAGDRLGALLQGVGEWHRRLGEALGEGVVDAVLNQNGVDADAGDRAEWRFTQEKTGSISCIFARSEAGGAG